MTREDAIEAIVDGQTPLAFQAHQLAAWYFSMAYGHAPSIEELRQYLPQWTNETWWAREVMNRRSVHDQQH